MDKAILVIDMPDKCWECPICASYQTSAFSIREYWCTANDNEDVDPDKKPDWCPLRQIPKKKLPYLTSSDHLIGFGEGYNACINDILGQ